MIHYVYILACSDGTVYTGYTTDLRRRLAEHNAGEGAKYTRGRTPVRVRYVEFWPSKGDALSREYELKQLSREQKDKLLPRNHDRTAVVFDPT